MKIGKALGINKIGKKVKKASFIGGKSSMLAGRILGGMAAVSLAAGQPELAVPLGAASVGMTTGGRALKKAGQGKSAAQIERQLVRDLTSNPFA